MFRFWSRFSAFGFFAGVLLLSAFHAYGQTIMKIGVLPKNSDLRCAFFWDTSHGVVGGVKCLYTYDSGTWTQAKYPEQPDTIKALRLLDGKNLYAAGGVSSIWETPDEGVTWELTTTKLIHADDIYMDNHQVVMGLNAQWIGMQRGTTFARLDAMLCAAAADDAKGFYSTDGGDTWPQAATPYYDGYSVVADTCDHAFYRLTDDGKIMLSESTDGLHWTVIYDFVTKAIDIMDGGSGGELFVVGTGGIWRSFDGGLTFSLAKGPVPTKADRRIFAFGPYYRYLITMDDTGAVWRWDFGNNYAAQILQSIANHDISGTLCRTRFSLVIPSPCSAPGVTLDSVRPISPSVLLDSISSQFGESVPADTLWFEDTLVGPGTHWLNIHFAGHFGEGQVLPFDTSIAIPITLDSNIPWPPLDTLQVPANCVGEVPFVIPALCPNEWITIDSVFAVSGSLQVDTVRSQLGVAHAFDTIWFKTFFGNPGMQQPVVSIKAHLGTDTSTSFEVSVPLNANVSITKPIAVPTIVHSIAACSAMQFPVLLDEACSGSIDSIHYLDSAHLVYLSTQTQLPVPAAQTDTLWFQCGFLRPGTHTTTLKLYTTIKGKKWDTVQAHITIIVSPNNAFPLVTATTATTLTNCRSTTIPILIHALPCDSMQVTGSTFSASSGLLYTATPSGLGTLAPGEVDTILVTVPPQPLSGNYSLALHVTGVYLGAATSFDTSIELRLKFTSATSILAPNLDSLTLGTITTCQDADTSVTFQNPGCDTLTVTGDATTWPAGWSASDPAFPFPLAPDSSFSIRLHFSPTGSGASNPLLFYMYRDKSGKAGSAQVWLSGNATQAPTSIAFEDSAIDFGMYTRCNAAHDTSVTITNTSCDSVSLLGTAIDGGSGFSLIQGSDTTLAPMQSAHYEIHFSDSTIGTRSSIVHLHAMGVRGGTSMDTIIPLFATILEGNHRATLSTQSIEFGTTSVCDERDSSITLTNIGCGADTLLASFANPSFGSASSSTIILPRNGSVVLPIFTNVDTTGHATTNTDTLSFSGNLDSPFPPVMLSRGITYPGAFRLTLTAESSAPVRASVPMYVLRNGTIPSAADEVDFDLIYNDNLLGYEQALNPDIQSTKSSLLPNGLLDRTFAMRPAGDRDTIAALLFQSYLAPNEQTPITLTHEQFLSAGVISPPCVASVDTVSPGAIFSLELACGDSTLIQAMAHEPPFRIERIVPNPASLRVEGSGQQIEAQVFNALGFRIFPSTLYPLPFTLNLSGMPSGIYFLRLSSGSYTMTRPFLVVH